MKWVMICSLLILNFGFSSEFARTVYAQEFKSPGYKIESGTLILQPELDQSSANYDLPASIGPDVQKRFEEVGYVVMENKASDSSEKPFIRLQLDKSQLVFDSAEVRGESVQQGAVNLSGTGSTNFIVSLRQQEQFKNSFGAAIEPTHCDSESPKCTPILAQIWKKAFGFGYRATGTTVRDFSKTDAFRPLFVDGLTSMSAVLFDGELDKAGRSLELKFKLRPQPQTQTGIYKGTVIITASADY